MARLCQRQGGKPLTVRGVRQGEPTQYFGKGRLNLQGGALKPFIDKGSRGTCPETPYPRRLQRGYWEMLYPHELPGMSLRAYGNNGES